MNTTKSFNSENADRKWLLVDLQDVVLGRAAARIAALLRGKHKPTFTPNGDVGDFVVVVNADKVKLTGNKWADKQYWRHSGYMGGIKSTTARELRDKDAPKIIELAVKGMLPRGPLGRRQFKKLKVYAGADHPHGAQMPEPTDLGLK